MSPLQASSQQHECKKGNFFCYIPKPSKELTKPFRTSSFLRALDRRFLVPEVVFLGGDRK